MKSAPHPLRSPATRGKSTFLNSRKLVLRGFELHAVVVLYSVQINIPSPGGACNTINEKSDNRQGAEEEEAKARAFQADSEIFGPGKSCRGSTPARLILKSSGERCEPKENAKFPFMTLPCKFWCRHALAKPVWRRMLPGWSMRLPLPVQPPAGGSHQTNNIVPALGKTRGSVVFAHTKRETCQQENEPRKSDGAYLLGVPLKQPASAKGSMESPS